MKTLFIRRMLDVCIFCILDCFGKDDQDIKDAVISIHLAINHLIDFDSK